MNLSREQFLKIMPNARTRVDAFLDPLNEAMAEFEINTPARQQAFLSQLAHESAEFRYMQEIASGSSYEGRADLGNTHAGDGIRFKGRGPIQITGRKNYGLVGDALGLDLLGQPRLLEQPQHGCRSAAWFWRVGAGLNLSKRAIAYGVPVGCDLNNLADAGDFEGITLAVNGGMNGWDDRQKYFAKAQTTIAEQSVA
jgi:putative chitinase